MINPSLKVRAFRFLWVYELFPDVSLIGGLTALNSRLRQIDLFCKLVGPLAVSALAGISTTIAIWVVFGLSLASVFLEYYAISQVSLSAFAGIRLN
jgi:solute carrier family 40 (iron-regulated transporter), member 1